MLACCKIACERHASDIHVTVETPPLMRIHGELVRMDFPPLTPKDTDELLMSICPAGRAEKFRATGQVDFSYSVPGTGRFRVNAFRQRGSTAFAIRILRSAIPRLEDLGLPPAVGELSDKNDGLVLITGATGSGKSSTLAAMVNRINTARAGHVITLEDPVEFLHKHGRSIVNQREVGSDTASFADGIRAALREDPDVIVIGELRDLETATIALSAAETGHLILATIHAPRATQAVNRLVDLFPLPYQQQARVQLSDVLQGIVAQQLLPREDGPGRVAACEVLVATAAARAAIKEGDARKLYEVIRDGGESGMITMEQSLDGLYAAARISAREHKTHSAGGPGN
jgi:twitching motility protein PilT